MAKLLLQLRTGSFCALEEKNAEIIMEGWNVALATMLKADEKLSGRQGYKKKGLHQFEREGFLWLSAQQDVGM